MRHPLAFGVISALLATGFVWIVSSNVKPVKSLPLKETIQPASALPASYSIAKSDATINAEAAKQNVQRAAKRTVEIGTGRSEAISSSSRLWRKKQRANLELNLALDDNSCVKEASYVAGNVLDPAALFSNIGWEQTSKFRSGKLLVPSFASLQSHHLPSEDYCILTSTGSGPPLETIASYDLPPQPRIIDSSSVARTALPVGAGSHCQGMWECSTGKMPINVMLVESAASVSRVVNASAKPVAPRFDKAMIQGVVSKFQFPADAKAPRVNIDFNDVGAERLKASQAHESFQWDLLGSLATEVSLLQVAAGQLANQVNQTWSQAPEHMSCSEQEFAMNLPTEQELLQTGSNWSAGTFKRKAATSSLAVDSATSPLSPLELEIISAACEVLHVDPAFCGNDPFFNPYDPIVDANRKVGSGLALEDPFAYDGATKFLVQSAAAQRAPYEISDDSNRIVAANLGAAKSIQNAAVAWSNGLLQGKHLIAEAILHIQSLDIRPATNALVDAAFGKLQNLDLPRLLATWGDHQESAPASGPRYFVPIKPVQFRKPSQDSLPALTPIPPLRPGSTGPKASVLEATILQPLEKALEWEVFSGKSLGRLWDDMVVLIQQASESKSSQVRSNERQQFEQAIVSQQQSDDWGMTALMAGQCLGFAKQQSQKSEIIQPIPTASHVGLVWAINRLQTSASNQVSTWTGRTKQLGDTVAGLKLRQNDTWERIVLQHIEGVRR